MKNKFIPFLFAVCFLNIKSGFSQNVPKSTGSKVSRQDAQEALDFHNKVRKEVGTAPLEWSAEVAKYSQAWADHLAKEKSCQMEHRPNDGDWKRIYGENLFWGSGAKYTAKEASENWYSEIKDYKNEPLNNSNWYGVGHYTQMVWKNTTKVGIGQATCPNGDTIIVGNYDPAGNYLGEKAY